MLGLILLFNFCIYIFYKLIALGSICICSFLFGILCCADISLNKLFILGSPAMQRTPTKGNQQGSEGIHGTSTNLVYYSDN